MSRAGTAVSHARPEATLPPIALPSFSPAAAAAVANPFASAPPRSSHEGVLFLDDSVVVPRSAFEVADGESEGGSLPGLEGPRPAGAVRHRITRAGTTPPVALQDWDPVKPPPRPAGEEETRQQTTEEVSQDAWKGNAENDSPFVAADGPQDAPLFPDLGSAAQGLAEQPSWVDARPSASALLSPFVASAQLAVHRSSNEELVDSIDR